MHTKFLSALAAGLGLLACSQTKEAPSTVETAPDDLVNLSVSVPALSTRATAADDAAVNRFQVFVFRADGTLETGSYGADASQTVKVSRGQKTVAVLVNCAQITASVTATSLLSTVLNLSDNGLSSVQMYGTSSVNLSGDSSIEVEVTRLVAKIGIADITNAITLEQYKDLTMTVNGIYLINVAGDRSIDGTAATTTWYNRMQNMSECTALLSDRIDRTVASGSVFEADRVFYCYPNSNADSTDQTWSPRSTRLVVEVQLGTETWYYPITVPDIRENTFYEISGLRITRIGATSPDEVLEFDNATFTVTVKAWEDSPVSEVTI